MEEENRVGGKWESRTDRVGRCHGRKVGSDGRGLEMLNLGE